MTRHVGRSRGCKPCLQRKIKCDEKLPECTQCISRKQKCPGPVVGAVFIAMKPKAKRSEVKRSGDMNSQRPRSISSDNSQSPHSGGTNEIVSLDGNQLPVVLRSQFLLPSSYQPSRTAPFEELFLDHFVSSFDTGRLHRTTTESWYSQLPAIYNTSSHQTSQDSIRAAITVHYGAMTTNTSIQTEAYRWYAKALEGQRTILQKDKLLPRISIPTEEEILTPVLLTLFELVATTTVTGWINHSLGSAAMLEMRRPENCQEGLAHLLFRAQRMTIVYMSMSTGKQHAFATPPWTTVPFELNPKTTFDRLLDILLLIPGCLSFQNEIRHIFTLDTPEGHKLRLELELMVSGLLDRLQDWWQEYIEEVAATTGGLLYGLGAMDAAESERPYFPDAFAAACTATYHAGNIALKAILASTLSHPRGYDSQIGLHANLILASSSYLIANSSSSAGTVMMVFPLKTICHSGRNELQRQSAFELLEMWGGKSGIQGICANAAPLY